MLGKTLETWKTRAKALKTEIQALMIAYRDPRTPWIAKAWAVLVVAYALSPIDLIPDFIPVLGYLDDLILLPLGIALAVRLIPPEVMDAARKTATQAPLLPPILGVHLCLRHSRRQNGGTQGGLDWLGVGLICLAWLSLLGLGIAAFVHQSK